MDGQRFDEITKVVATSTSRRLLLRGLAAWSRLLRGMYRRLLSEGPRRDLHGGERVRFHLLRGRRLLRRGLCRPVRGVQPGGLPRHVCASER
jgi:hypothetical protein